MRTEIVAVDPRLRRRVRIIQKSIDDDVIILELGDNRW